MSGCDPQELIDRQPFADVLQNYISNSRDMFGLPQEFNIAVRQRRGRECARRYNDIGFVAMRVGEGRSVAPGCRSCDVACNEQNGIRGISSGGAWRFKAPTYPDTQRTYLSMGCNHCLTAGCLKGCPIDAYTKGPLTGIVLHSVGACIAAGLRFELFLQRVADFGARRCGHAICAAAEYWNGWNRGE